jgi:vancomycin permeability regulator SanA
MSQLSNTQTVYSRRSWLASLTGRCVLAWLALFTLLNLLLECLGMGRALNLWWIDLRFLPPAMQSLFLIGFACAVLLMLVHPRITSIRLTGVIYIGLVLLIVLNDTLTVYRLAWAGDIKLWFPVPMSLIVFLLVFAGTVNFARSTDWSLGSANSSGPMPGASIIADQTRKLFANRSTGTAVGLVAAGCIFLLLTAGFLLGQMALLGQTDYRRPVDAVVVLGARAMADGRPSDMLLDRVQTGIELYRKGYAKTLIMSGGPGDGAWHEAQVMRRLAVEAGVPESSIVMDFDGLNTTSSAKNTAALLKLDTSLSAPAGKVIVVSHGYHLPRARLLFERAGVLTVTVPAKVRYTPRKLPYFVFRESVALVRHYVLP